jgi:hypothetical protein
MKGVKMLTNLKLKAAELEPDLMMVQVFDEANDLLCSMPMPTEVWNDDQKRKDYIYREFVIEAERVLREI